MVLREFSVALALLLIALLVYLLLLGRLTGWTFAVSLVGVAILVGVVGVVLPRGEDVTELGAKVRSDGAELLVKLERVKQDIYAKAEALQRLAEKIGELSAFNVAQLWRFPPAEPEAVRLQERDRLARMLREAGIPEPRVQEIVEPITAIVARDLIGEVWRAVPVGDVFGERGPAKGQDVKAVRQRLTALLLESKVGTAVDASRSEFQKLGAWTPEVERRVHEFDEFRKSGVLPRSQPR